MTAAKVKTTKPKQRIVVPVVDTSNKEVEKIELDPVVFDGKVSSGSIYSTIANYLANRRSGTASTKTISDVSGSGRKPWRQKGTGRARVGSIRTPIWRHGGIVFGPHPRDFSYQLPKKIKKLALKSSLNDRALHNEIIIVNTLVSESYKTKRFAEILKKLDINDKVLLVVNTINDNVLLSIRNIPFVELINAQNLNAYDVMRHKKILFTKESLQKVIGRLK